MSSSRGRGERCRVFSSIRHDEIRVDATKHAGTRVLKRYLKYAQTGELDVPVLTGAEMDSPFEEAVAMALQSHGHRVAAQVGSAGFRIDLAVYDPDDEGRFVLAIECDGARYHSSSWARERDRLRQTVLEQKGWRFHRIWSTDWFYDRDNEMAKLLEAIDRAWSVGGAELIAPAAEPRRQVQRSGTSEAANQSPQPYREASFLVPESEGTEIHVAPEPLLERCVTRIVEEEGPVHADEVVRCLSSL